MSAVEEINPYKGDVVAALVLEDALGPEGFFYDIYGSRTTFKQWEKKDGLPIYRRNGKRMVRPSELTKFIETLTK